MKYLVASDIHGSLYYANKIIEKFKEENCDKIILLGDLYYHGPRNPLPKDYNPMEVAKLFNSYKAVLEVIKGNCDAEVDEMISEFSFNNHIIKEIGKKRVYFTHGHHQNIDNIPSDVDILIYGHFHTGFIKEHNNVICVNSGSVALPKNGTNNSYLVVSEKLIELKDLSSNIIDRIEL